MYSSYEDRRPIADPFRRTAHAAVAACLRLGIRANTVSYASVVAAAGAALCFWRAADAPWLLLLAAALCGLRLWFNMLDGMVALAGGQASRWGAVVNELPDRISDAVIFLGVGLGGLADFRLGALSAIAALLVAYVGTLGQAVGAGRQFGGWMSKPWRMAALCTGALVTLGFALAGIEARSLLGSWTPIDLALGIVLLGCVQTMATRLRAIHAALSAPPAELRS
jgi:phosphatidylglycerophosphate synthase